MLKSVSRRRSEVGRIASELGPLSERPRQRPPTILMVHVPSTAAARGSLGTTLRAAFEAALRCAARASLEATGPAPRPAARWSIATGRAATGTVIVTARPEG